ncbi:TPA: hypothetical protein ACTEN7_000332 [Legionella pneumophila]
MNFLFANAHELAALLELPYIQRLVYLMGVRPYMDRHTNIVGIKRRISYQSLRETLYVAPIAGVKTGSPSLQQMKRAIKSLERAGLVEIQSTEKHLILKCILAELDKSAPDKAEPRPIDEPDTNPTHSESVNSEALEVIHKNLDIVKATEADPPQKSEINYIFLYSKFEKFWNNYPRQSNKQSAMYQFTKLNPDDRLFAKILSRLKQQVEFYNQRAALGEWQPDWKYPATWLAHECWNDDPMADKLNYIQSTNAGAYIFKEEESIDL